LATAGFGVAIFPAAADTQTYTITLATGQTLTVEGPAGAVDLAPPGVTVPIIGVTPEPAPAGTSTATQPAAAPAPGEPVPTAQGEQPTTGKTVRKPRPEAEGAVEPADETADKAKARKKTDLREADGTPTETNPTFSFALPGPAPIGVPNFFIEKFRIPPFLLPIYQAAGIQYGVRWELLAAINEIETDYGRNLNVSSAGALGWMQFMPASWKTYGVDANDDGQKDPYNPVDAIFAAARYLKAAGADTDVRQAVFAYNHADWYVDSVLLRARLIGGLPADLVSSLTGLTQAHFPVHAKATYADDIAEAVAARKAVKAGRNAAMPVDADVHRKGIDIYAKAGSPVIAVQDGKIVKTGRSERLGTFVQLRDVYGNTYTYGHLKKLASAYPVPKERKAATAAQVRKELALPKADPKPTAPASAGKQQARTVKPARRSAAPRTKERLYANPGRPSAYRAGGEDQLLDRGATVSGTTTFRSYFTEVFGLKRDDVVLKRLKVGSKVVAGTILGRIGTQADGSAPHVLFEIRPAGKDAPRVDPKPILDGWKLLETTAIYRAAGKNPFFGPDAKNPTIGQVLLMSKEALQRRVVANPRIELYGCGERDVKAGIVDRRVLATLEFLAASGLKPTVTSLRCGHSYLSKSGNVSEHSSGNAVDIAAINGITISPETQGEGSITDLTIRRLLTLQGTMRPHQIISLMTFEGADNTFALPDHADHIHVGFRPLYGDNPALARQAQALLKPAQWTKLIDRLGQIDNPSVRVKPSKYAIAVAPPRTAGD
jgi:murein DD-endopeptidase MepM/ murein hydrolase activator NlpD